MLDPYITLLEILRKTLRDEKGLYLDNEAKRDHVILVLYDAITQALSLKIIEPEN